MTNCPKCNSILIAEPATHHGERIDLLRCYACGTYYDPVIEKNRKELPKPWNDLLEADAE